MASTTCKLQLLALAVLTSVLSVGSSLLLLLAWPGCCRGQPLVAVHVPLSVGLAQHGSPPDPLHWRVDRLPARNSSLPRGTPAGESTEILLKGEAMEATDSEANSSLSSVPTTTDLSRETEVTGKEEVQSSSVRGNNSFVMKKHKLSSKRLREIRQLARGNLTAPAGVSAGVSKVLHTHNHSSPYGERKIDTSTPLPHLKWSPVTNITDIPLSALCPVKRCEHFLSEEERQIYQLCGEKASEWLGQRRGSECHCTFLNGTGRPTVALASLPGSGNTWLRGLLERATGVCTGSVFCDKTLRAGGMCGEGLRGSSVLGSKTHDTRLQWTGVHYKEGVWSEKRPFYDAAIVLVRNPYKAIIAEWNRQKAYRYSREQPGSSHVKYLEGPRFFLSHPAWGQFVGEQVRKWRMTIVENVVRSRGHAVLVVLYEQLQSDTVRQVQRVLDFLHFPYSPQVVERALEGGFNSFYRNHTDTFSHFTTQQMSSINDSIVATANRLRSYGLTHLADQLNAYIDAE